jgi:hypothetical protein
MTAVVLTVRSSISTSKTAPGNTQTGVTVVRKSNKWKYPNAQKHAVFSKFHILPGEDRREFKKLIDELAGEWRPEGETEHDTILEIGKAIWLKRRLQLFLEVEGLKNASNPNHRSFDVRIGLLGFLARVAASPASGFSHGEHYLPKELLEALREDFPRKKVKPTVESNAEWYEAMKKGIASLLPSLNSMYSDKYHFGLMNAAATFSGDLFERAIKLDERLNAMIDRAIKRLVQIKAMKQMLAHPLKEAKGEAIELPARKNSVGVHYQLNARNLELPRVYTGSPTIKDCKYTK